VSNSKGFQPLFPRSIFLWDTQNGVAKIAIYGLFWKAKQVRNCGNI